jgi:hypothetical protein
MYHDDEKNVYIFGMHRWLPVHENYNNTSKMGNTNPKHLLCFENGVYDLNTYQFRDGNKLDFCTLCTNYDFPITNNKLNDYLHSVFPEKEDYIYFIKTIYLLFRGDSYFVYNILSLNSGSSTLYRLISLMFGDYFRHEQHLTSRKMYTFATNGQWLSKKYKGRCLYVHNLDTFDYNLPILTTFDKKINLPNARELKFKAKFDGSGSYINTYKLAPELMLKMIQLHQSLPNKLIFSHVEGLNTDIIWYIYQLYDLQLFL